MTEVQFHSGLADPLGYACRLLRKSQRVGARVAVAGDAALLDRLDVELWTFEPGSFVPHLRVKAGQSVARRLQDTPIWLADDVAEVPHHAVLVNLGPTLCTGFERFERLIELVGNDAEAAAAGRVRWQHFKSRGYPLQHLTPAAEAPPN